MNQLDQIFFTVCTFCKLVGFAIIFSFSFQLVIPWFSEIPLKPKCRCPDFGWILQIINDWIAWPISFEAWNLSKNTLDFHQVMFRNIEVLRIWKTQSSQVKTWIVNSYLLVHIPERIISLDFKDLVLKVRDKGPKRGSNSSTNSQCCKP